MCVHLSKRRRHHCLHEVLRRLNLRFSNLVADVREVALLRLGRAGFSDVDLARLVGDGPEARGLDIMGRMAL